WSARRATASDATASSKTLPVSSRRAAIITTRTPGAAYVASAVRAAVTTPAENAWSSSGPLDRTSSTTIAVTVTRRRSGTTVVRSSRAADRGTGRGDGGCAALTRHDGTRRP